MKPLRVVCVLAVLVLFAAARFSFAQKTVFADVPKSHWVYDAVPHLIKAKIMEGYPTCCYGRCSKPRLLTRYEFAVMTKRALDTMKPPAKLTAQQKKLLPLIQRMAREFAPELKQLGR